MTTTQQFLNLIHGPDARIYFNVGRSTWKTKPQTYIEAETKLRWRNSQGDDICYIVNGGGTKDAEISRINAVFLDWDAGRDEAGKYFTLDIVINKKQEFRSTLDIFPLTPSILVETRNGFHAYWLLEPGVKVEQFRNCQLRLARYFQSDTTVQNPARVMRLPGYSWNKPGSGCEPFHVDVLECKGDRYKLDDILTKLPPINEINMVGKEPLRRAVQDHNKCSGITKALNVVLDPPPSSTTMKSYPEGINYLKKQDLGQFLGLGPSSTVSRIITCPFHEDKTPSGSLTQSPGTGFWRYKCFSGRCGVSGSIIDLTMRRPETPTWEKAIRYLFDLYSIKVKTDWRQEQETLLEYNLSLLDDADQLSEYPSLFRIIRRVLPDLKAKIRLARQYLVSDRLQDEDGCAIFYCSLRQFHQFTSKKREHPKYFNRQNQKVDRFCLLGLLKKLPDDAIPEELLKKAREVQYSRKFANRVQFYSIPVYTDSVLQNANTRARILVEAGASVRGISSSMIRDLYGPQVAQEVYPQLKHIQPSSAETALREKIVQALEVFIADQGYCRIQDIRHALMNTKEWRSVTDRRIDRLLPGIFRELGLRKVICNKELKDRLRIQAVGYPAIILKGKGPSG